MSVLYKAEFGKMNLNFLSKISTENTQYIRATYQEKFKEYRSGLNGGEQSIYPATHQEKSKKV